MFEIEVVSNLPSIFIQTKHHALVLIFSGELGSTDPSLGWVLVPTEAAQNVPALAFIGWPLVPFLPRPQSQILTYATWIKNIGGFSGGSCTLCPGW